MQHTVEQIWERSSAEHRSDSPFQQAWIPLDDAAIELRVSPDTLRQLVRAEAMGWLEARGTLFIQRQLVESLRKHAARRSPKAHRTGWEQ